MTAVLVPARLAHPAEIPTAARALLNACADPWRARTLYAVGPVPYSWSVPGTLDDNGQRRPGTRTDGGHRLTACVLVQLGHPDSRRAAAVFTSDSLQTKLGEKVPKGHEGPRRPPVILGPDWRLAFAYRWRERRCDAVSTPCRRRVDDIPRPIGALTLRAAVADPTWRATPYMIEEAA